MISADGDEGPRGKGRAAENVRVAHALAFGRDEKIGATVTDLGVVLLDILTLVTVLNGTVLFYLVSQNFYIKRRKLWKVLFGRLCPRSLPLCWRL